MAAGVFDKLSAHHFMPRLVTSRKQNFSLAVDAYILLIPVGCTRGYARPIGIDTGRTGKADWFECSCGENLKLFSGLFTFLLR